MELTFQYEKIKQTKKKLKDVMRPDRKRSEIGEWTLQRKGGDDYEQKNSDYV